MSIGSEIEKLSSLRDKGILSDTEFQSAKSKLLNTMGEEHNSGTGVNKIGNAALSWVNLQWVSYAVGLMAAALITFYIFIPHLQSMKKSEEAFNKNFETTKKEIEEAHKDMDIRSKEFDKDFEKKKNEIEDFRKKNFGN
jgi:flagellar biosynthesis/type III secretory pathway M-ring protein FliF/YscJ